MTSSPRAIPADDFTRQLTVARPETDETLLHLAVLGGTSTVLVSGAQTAGRYTLIDMPIPPGGGPPLHRHDYEEMFTLLEGEVELAFRDQVLTARAGETINIPANAPHRFKNVSAQPARLLCLCTPAGQEEYFAEIGVVVPTRTSPAPGQSPEQQAESRQKAMALAAKYRSEFLLS
ncbi:cupin domain-containing protein [Deinococcus hopiensis]|uniref:Cupin domain-containing protein n=1 Tax=Deinococcus hopiensis KR-140 TaxID=695939 RepID=A0A1W1UXB4_9DEIO|nr:cupin domain-containing protein [Deinococcus hopiensis]SMB85364.1 Cupin domain-containing protein [Deinococcus hopiensis KR-140]